MPPRCGELPLSHSLAAIHLCRVFTVLLFLFMIVTRYSLFLFLLLLCCFAVLLAHNLNFSNAAAFATSTLSLSLSLPALCSRGSVVLPSPSRKSSLHLLLVLIFTFNWQNRIDSYCDVGSDCAVKRDDDDVDRVVDYVDRQVQTCRYTSVRACSLKIVISNPVEHQMSLFQAFQTMTRLAICRLIWPQFAQPQSQPQPQLESYANCHLA